MKSKPSLLAASLVAFASCGTAFAQTDSYYAEGIVGFSSFKLTTGAFTNNTFTQIAPATAGTAPNTVTITGKDKSDMAYGLRFGYQMTDIFSFEGSYFLVGTAKVSGTAQLNTPTASASAVTWSTDLEVTKWNVGVAARHKFAEKFVVVGRISLGTSTAEWGKRITTATSTATDPSAGKILSDAFRSQERRSDFDCGLAASYRINDRWNFGVGWDYLSGKQAAHVGSWNLRFSF